MASHGSCFMVTWAIIQDRMLEVGRMQNQETMALQMPTTMYEDLHE